MKERLYDIKDLHMKVIVYEVKRQKDILVILDELIENAESYGWSYTFKDDSFYIKYKDGEIYEANECGEGGVYKKKSIEKIIYENANDTWVYGRYDVDDYGVVY